MIRRLAAFNLLTGVALGVGGYFLGHWVGGQIDGSSLAYVADTGQSDVDFVLGYLVGFLGFLLGLGVLNYPISRLLGGAPALPRPKTEGVWRYFEFTADHKVVAKQYFVGVGLFFAIAGLNAMLIRVELLHPEQSIWPPDKYLSIVGMHGSMMMGIMTSAVLGPFANFFVPLLIGARRSAFPRIEALSFWLLMAAGATLLLAGPLGGFQTGWTGYAPLSEQGVIGAFAYILFFALVALSITALGFNLAATVITMRAPEMTWGRLPIFAWGILTTAVMMILAAPVLFVGLMLLVLDRAAQTSFYLSTAGGSNYLYENLFWFFGHPEVYLLMIPGAGILLQLLPVFTRKPLWGYRIAVAGMVGIAVVSFTVWQHHLFVSGLGADVRTFYMFSTEVISIPTGLIVIAALGTLWRGRIRFEVPMLFCLAWIFNFLIGGITGIYQSDVPSNVTTHGSFFVLAHFHYTIMGALVFVFFAAIYYWLPKMYGRMLDGRLGRIHFWLMFLGFNSTFFPLFIAGFLGMPRRVVTYPEEFEALNEWASVSAFVLGFSMLVFLANLLYTLVLSRTPAPDNPWNANSLEWQTSSPPPPHNFDVIPEIGHPHDYGADEGLEPVPAPAPERA